MGAVKKAAKDTGTFVNTGINDIGNAIEQGIQDTGNAIEKGVQDTGKGLERAGQVFGDAIAGFDAFGDLMGGGDGGNTSVSDQPSYSLDTESAEKRNKALTLRRGFLSTRRATSNKSTANTLTPTLTGKTKLGQ